jgi:3-deoxy-7-phosphoheptulonate synthase
MPVGFKNGTDGGLDVALNAIRAARASHRFAGIAPDGRSALLRTRGNPDGHLVLRGGRDAPNFGSRSVARATALLGMPAAARPVLVDCSHDNSGKDHHRQAHVCRAVLNQFRAGRRSIMGVSIESNLAAGRQDWQPGAVLRPGTSITDSCIGWNETEDLLYETAEAAKTAR